MSDEKSVRPPVQQRNVLRKLVFPVKALTFVWRFLALLAWTAYLEGNRDLKG